MVAFADLDGDQGFDDGEPTVSDVRVKMESDDGSYARVLALGDGPTCIDDLEPGSYGASMVSHPPGYVASGPQQYRVRLLPNSTAHVRFGLVGVGNGGDGDEKAAVAPIVWIVVVAVVLAGVVAGVDWIRRRSS